MSIVSVSNIYEEFIFVKAIKWGNPDVAHMTHLLSIFNSNSILYLLNLSYDGGGPYVPPPQSVFIFLLKISPPDQTLRPTCKFLILGILYHDFFFFWKFSI